MMRKRLVRFKNEFRKQSSIAIVAAFGFLIALVWRDFISELVNHLTENFQGIGSVYVYKLIAAIFVTAISIVGIVFASKLNVRVEEKK
jgi:hypothetical protein